MFWILPADFVRIDPRGSGLDGAGNSRVPTHFWRRAGWIAAHIQIASNPVRAGAIVLFLMVPRILRVLTVRDRPLFGIAKMGPQVLKTAETFRRRRGNSEPIRNVDTSESFLGQLLDGGSMRRSLHRPRSGVLRLE